MGNYTTRRKINHEGARRKEESALAVSFVRLLVYILLLIFFLLSGLLVLATN
jgi:hypothetical protein